MSLKYEPASEPLAHVLTPTLQSDVFASLESGGFMPGFPFNHPAFSRAFLTTPHLPGFPLNYPEFTRAIA